LIGRIREAISRLLFGASFPLPASGRQSGFCLWKLERDNEERFVDLAVTHIGRASGERATGFGKSQELIFYLRLKHWRQQFSRPSGIHRGCS
jgi:hypothetical protein